MADDPMGGAAAVAAAAKSAFTSDAVASGGTKNVMLTLYGDCCHDHTGNADVDLGGGTLRQFLSAINDTNRETDSTGAPTNRNPDYNTISNSFLSVSKQPTSAIHNYFTNSKPEYKNDDYTPGKLMIRTPGRNLLEITKILKDYGVNRALVDSYNYNPYAKAHLGYNKSPAGGHPTADSDFKHLNTITTGADAAPKLTETGGIGKDEAYRYEPFEVQFYKGHSFTYSVNPSGHNVIQINDGTASPTTLTCEIGFSVNAISDAIGLAQPRTAQTEEGVDIVKFTRPITITPAALTPRMKAQIMTVKQLTDFGQFYQATYITRVEKKKTVLVTIDKYFKEIMENRSMRMKPGFVIVMDRNENQLWCLHNDHLATPAGEADIAAKLWAYRTNIPGNKATIMATFSGLFTFLETNIPELYTNAYVYPFKFNIEQIKQEIETYLDKIGTIASALEENSAAGYGAIDPGIIAPESYKDITAALSSTRIEDVATSIYNKLQNIITDYFKFTKECRTLIERATKSEGGPDEIIDIYKQLAGFVYDFFCDPVNFIFAGARVSREVIPLEERNKLVGYILSYLILSNIKPTTKNPSVYEAIHKYLYSKDTSRVCAASFYEALRVHWRSGAIAGARKVAIHSFYAMPPTPLTPPVTTELKLPRTSPFLLELTKSTQTVRLEYTGGGTAAYVIGSAALDTTDKYPLYYNNTNDLNAIAAVYNNLNTDKKIAGGHIKSVTTPVVPFISDVAPTAPAAQSGLVSTAAAEEAAAKASVAANAARAVAEAEAELAAQELAAEEAASVAAPKKPEPVYTIYNLYPPPSIYGSKNYNPKKMNQYLKIITKNKEEHARYKSNKLENLHPTVGLLSAFMRNVYKQYTEAESRTPSAPMYTSPQRVEKLGKRPPQVTVIDWEKAPRMAGGGNGEDSAFKEYAAVINTPNMNDLARALIELAANITDTPAAPLDQKDIIKDYIATHAASITDIVNFMRRLINILYVMRDPAYEMGLPGIEQFDEVYESIKTIKKFYEKPTEEIPEDVTNKYILGNDEVITTKHLLGLILDACFISPFFTDGLYPSDVLSLVDLLLSCIGDGTRGEVLPPIITALEEEGASLQRQIDAGSEDSALQAKRAAVETLLGKYRLLLPPAAAAPVTEEVADAAGEAPADTAPVTEEVLTGNALHKKIADVTIRIRKATLTGATPDPANLEERARLFELQRRTAEHSAPAPPVTTTTVRTGPGFGGVPRRLSNTNFKKAVAVNVAAAEERAAAASGPNTVPGVYSAAPGKPLEPVKKGGPSPIGSVRNPKTGEWEPVYANKSSNSGSTTGTESSSAPVVKSGGSRHRRSTKSRRHLRRTRRRADAAKARRKQTRRFR